MDIRSKTNRAEVAFVYLLVPYAVGMIGAHQQESKVLIYVFGTACMLLLCTIAVVGFYYKKLSLYKIKWATGLPIYTFMLFLGAFCYASNDTRLSADYYGHLKSDYLKINIIDEPQLKNGTLRFKAQVHSSYFLGNPAPASGKLMVGIIPNLSNPLTLSYGDVLIIPALFKTIESPQNPGEFDYKGWLATQHIHHQVFLKQDQLRVTTASKKNPLIAYALKLRQQQVDYFRKTLKSDDAFAMASTLILGYRGDLSQETLNIYSRTGTIHVLSVSGMHVGLIYLILSFLLSFMDHGMMSKLKTTLIILLLWFYVVLTGCSPSVIRSGIMLTVFILAKASTREINGYNILAFAALCMLLFEPYLIWDIGFQLSFLAVFGLIGVQPLIYNHLRSRNLVLSKLGSSVAMSVAAQLSTFPLSVYYFHQFPLFFLISNLFIIVPSAVIMYAGLFALLFRPDFMMPYFEKLISFMNGGLNTISALPYSSLSGIWMNKSQLFLLSFFLIMFLLSIKHGNKSLFFSCLFTLFLLRCSVSYDNLKQLKQREIIIFKLRKNHAIAIVFGTKAILYTDLHRSNKSFRYQLQPGLDLYGVKQLTIINETVPLYH